MHHTLKTEIRFKEFRDVFGIKGIVAMAWSLGAQHAERIRQEQGSFPFLYISGAQQSGKSLLLSYLTKLTGNEASSSGAERVDSYSPIALMRAQLNQQVLIYHEPTEPQPGFDMASLLPLYSGGQFRLMRSGQSTDVVFRGALAIHGTDSAHSQALDSRMIHLELTRNEPAWAKTNSLKALALLSAEQAGLFRHATRLFCDDIFSFFNPGVSAYAKALLHEHGSFINARVARNFGQLMALVDLLCLLLMLPNTLRLQVMREVQHMVLFDRLPI